MYLSTKYSCPALIQTIINNVALFREAKHLLQTLTPIADALDKLQSDYTNIADACETWINLLQNDDLQPHRVQIQKRFDQAMTPNHFLAHCLHPKYRGRNLTAEQLLGAHHLLISNSPSQCSMTHALTNLIRVCGGRV